MKNVNIVDVSLLLVIVLLLIWSHYRKQLHPETMITSEVDGNTYTVKKNYYNIKTASDVLAKLNGINMIMINHLEKKYADSTWEDDVDFLKGNYSNGIY